jgi:hypothetical protein
VVAGSPPFVYTLTSIALALALLTTPPIGATMTSAQSTGAPIWFSNPALGMKGTITPIAGAHFEVVVIALGDAPLEAELRQFTLVAANSTTFEPIAAGGGADLIFPIDSMPLGRELGQILPSDAMVSLKRTTPVTVMVEADAHATLAFVFQVPEGTALRALKLPDGAELPLPK